MLKCVYCMKKLNTFIYDFFKSISRNWIFIRTHAVPSIGDMIDFSFSVEAELVSVLVQEFIKNNAKPATSIFFISKIVVLKILL